METTAKMIENLKADGITLANISEELNYRDMANDARWNDNLYEYSTEELQNIENEWN